ncbi:hypothetical protein M432DRAFT_678507 [Thermoascus aurantiacus ATCC 26904]
MQPQKRVVYDSSDKCVYSSGCVIGIQSNERDDRRQLLVSTKWTTEYLFDWFIVAYINGIRSLSSQTSKRNSTTGKWMSALTDAEQAHRQQREAAEMAKEGRFAEAEATAEAGVNQLNLSVSELPGQLTYERELESTCDGGGGFRKGVLFAIQPPIEFVIILVIVSIVKIVSSSSSFFLFVVFVRRNRASRADSQNALAVALNMNVDLDMNMDIARVSVSVRVIPVLKDDDDQERLLDVEQVVQDALDTLFASRDMEDVEPQVEVS